MAHCTFNIENSLNDTTVGLSTQHLMSADAQGSLIHQEFALELLFFPPWKKEVHCMKNKRNGEKSERLQGWSPDKEKKLKQITMRVNRSQHGREKNRRQDFASGSILHSINLIFLVSPTSLYIHDRSSDSWRKSERQEGGGVRWGVCYALTHK